MASSNVSPESRRQQIYFALWAELLPGLEQFLTETLVAENLSPFAENRRQFFVERLDILKLPPTLPPREGRKLSAELLKETEEKNGEPSVLPPDFAAYQRELARSLATKEHNPYEDDDEGVEKEMEKEEKEVKLYDVIDVPDAESGPKTVSQIRHHSTTGSIAPSKNSDDEDDDDGDDNDDDDHNKDDVLTSVATFDVDDDNDLYEVPVERNQEMEPRLSRGDPDTRSNQSVDDKPPELPYRPPLAKRYEIYTTGKSEKSDKSDDKSDPDELSGDGDTTSYESFDEENEHHDTELMNKLDIKLPKKAKKKSALKKSKKLSKSRSSSQWEISVPFHQLDSIDISGELYYRGKLGWKRRTVAISGGFMALYKPDKESRPLLVIQLTGYEAVLHEREGKRGCEIKLNHPSDDSHTFSVDFRDWANLWIEHINGTSKGEPPPKYHLHLARSVTSSGQSDTNYGSKSPGKGSEPMFLFDEDDYDEVESPFKNDFPEAQRELSEYDTASEDSNLSPQPSLKSRTLNAFQRSLGQRSFGKGLPWSSSKTLAGVGNQRFRSLRSLQREKKLGAAVKEILRRRQAGQYQVQQTGSVSKEVNVDKQESEDFMPRLQGVQPLLGHASSCTDLPGQPVPAKTLGFLPTLTHHGSATSLSRWDLKSVFYTWAMPLDQIMLALRRGDLRGSTSKLSTGSEGTSEETSSKSKLRGNKVMRMGSFAFRATQFFENIGKKSQSKSKLSTSLSHTVSSRSGDYSDVYKGIVEESSMSSANSTGNIPNSVLTPTSDISEPVFSDSSSVPTTPLDSSMDFLSETVEKNKDSQLCDVTHKGFLYIFSSFNRRRWGKRWCVIRENMFECYKNEQSRQCELNFLLAPCVLRRATAETNSEFGLMIIDCGKEKITVEPLSKEEMGPWVRVLMAETCTHIIPEGLEEYMMDRTHRGSDASSLLSFSVLKNWDMESLAFRNLQSPHLGSEPTDYQTNPCSNRPDESYLDNSILQSSSDFDLTLVNTSPSTELEQTMVPSPAMTSQGVKFPRLSQSSAIYKHQKPPTDSGFYSGPTSDTDSGCDNNSKEEEGDIDGGYATLDPIQRPKHAQTNSSAIIKRNPLEISSNLSKEKTGVLCSPYEDIHHVPCDSSIGSSRSNIASDVSSEVSPHHQRSPRPTTAYNNQSIDYNDNITLCSNDVKTSTTHSDDGHYEELLPSGHMSDQSQLSSSFTNPTNSDLTAAKLPKPSSTNSERQSGLRSVSEPPDQSCTSRTAPNGEEYSVVIKRSSRAQSEPVNNIGASQGHLVLSIDDDGLSRSPTEKFEELLHFGEELKETLSGQDKTTEQCGYELVQVSATMAQAGQSKPSSTELPVLANGKEGDNVNNDGEENKSDHNLDLNSSTDSDKLSCPSLVSISDKLETNAIAVSSSENSAASSTQVSPRPGVTNVRGPLDHFETDGNPPPLPTSPIPLLPKSPHNFTNELNFPETFLLPLCSATIPAESVQTGNSTTQKEECQVGTSEGLAMATGGLTEHSPHGVTNTTVTALVNDPEVKTEQLTAAISGLKDKLKQIKRRRMAVHDKRQRVSSDEERLACEKEFAALERAVESTDLDICTLQNQLDAIQGNTLEALRASHTRKKSSTRKKKNKRK